MASGLQISDYSPTVLYKALQSLSGHDEDLQTLWGFVNAALATKPLAVKRSVRSIHHFACSGGTIISKCIAAMPNVFLLSEIDPLSTMGYDPKKPHFSPTDIIRHLRFSARVVEDAAVIESYVKSIEAIVDCLAKNGFDLVIRDHSHSQYCVNRAMNSRPSHFKILERDFDVAAAVTVRNPIESYTSLIRNGWELYSPKGFDEYCGRYLEFLEDHSHLPVYKYEHFTNDPPAVLNQICQQLDLHYDDSWRSLIPIISLTGDSGRSSDVVSHRPRKQVGAELQEEIDKSDNWALLSSRLGYG